MAERTYVKDVLAQLQNHLQRHADKCDPMLDNHQIILFGVNNDDGITREVQDMSKLKDDIKQLKWALIAAIVIQLTLKFIPV